MNTFTGLRRMEQLLNPVSSLISLKRLATKTDQSLYSLIHHKETVESDQSVTLIPDASIALITELTRIAILDETVRKRIPHGSATRCNFKSRTISTVYEQLIECMGKIELTSKQAVAINQAGDIHRMLEDSKFVFWLTVFHNIMPHVDVLYNQLQKTRTDAALIRKQVNVLQQLLEKERKKMDTVTKEI
ncbi:hypothetical protein AVEN_116562-1 [Araneus ventricosus]|uniref:Uncharacterized protein n=1 Tax=Araneus ventricosus TaxID=182803 RepID=A0A4Y2TGJ3_ARAVE|nr:hypothetical protein AVEN_116562-1 [Araneus ventricosus]